MYQQLARNLYIVHNKDDYETLQTQRVNHKSELVIKEPDQVPIREIPWHPCRSMFIDDYPVLVSYGDDDNLVPTLIPVAKVIGGMGTIHQLDMRPAFNKLKESCANCVPFKQPRILLTGITIKPRTAPVRRGNEVRSTHNQDLMETMANLGMNLTQLKTLRIQFGDGRFHGSVEMKEEMMFVTQVRDITDHIAQVSMDPTTGKFDADYIFNHYDFMNRTPELREYKDFSKWEISVTTAVEWLLDSSKKD